MYQITTLIQLEIVFVHILNRGKSEAITVTETGGLGISWTAGEIYNETTDEFVNTTAGSGNLTNTNVNYLKWVSGTGLTISTTCTSGNEVLVATFSVYDGIINGYRETSLMNQTMANTRRGLRAAFPTRVISGMSVHEDTDGTNPLDVTMDAGVFWKDAIEQKTPVEIKSRNTAMVRHFHTAGVWDSDTNIQIETTNYDNGTQKTAIPANKYVKGLFIFMNGKIGFVYPTAYYTTIAQAQDAALPAMPTGLELLPKLTAVIYKQGVANFTNAIWQDVRAGISDESFNGVTDHGALAGLADDDHTQYVKDAEFTQNSGILVGTGAGTFAEETGATLRTSIGCAATAQTMYIGTTSVAINRGTGALTLAGITLTTPDIGTPTAGTLTNCSFPTLNQNTTGTAANVSGTPALPDGTTATTQAAANNSTKLATTAYADTAAAGGGATAALDNLASVAINAALVLGTSDAFALGSATKMWSDLFLASGSVVNFNNGDVTITHSANTLTVAGGTIASNVTGALTGNADTVTTNANLTGIVTSAGNATAIANKAIAIAKLADGTDGELITWSATGVIETVAVGTATHVLTSNGVGAAPTFQAVSATNITVADTADATCWVGLWQAQTGSQAPKSDGGITYNAETGMLTVTGVTAPLTGNVTGNCSGSSGTCSGLAATATALANARTIGGVSFNGTENIVPNTITIADESADTSCFVGFFTAATGGLQPKTGTNLTFNSSSGVLTATGFAGALTGNVTGDCSGSSGSCTGEAATVASATFTTALTVNTGTLTLTANIANNSVLTIGAGAVSISGANTGDQDLSGKADVGQTMHIGTTSVAINRASAALTLAGITLTTPDIGTPTAGVLTNCSGTAASLNIGGTAAVATLVTITDNEATNEANPIVFVAGADPDGGNLGLETDGTCTYNPSTGVITTTGFAGNVTGDCTGSSGSCTGESATVATINGLAPNTATTQAAQGNITSLGTLTGLTMGGDIAMGGNNIDNGGVIFLTEQADADADVAGKGQLWVNTATPNELWFTDDAGTDFQLGVAGAVPTQITVADESADETCFVGYFTAATGDLGPKTGTNLTFNSNTGILTASGFAGNVTGNCTGSSGTCTGNSATATLATTFTCTDNENEALACNVVFVDGATGAQGAETDGDLTYNPSTGTVVATAFTGALTGNVTGDCTGSSGTCTGEAATVATITTLAPDTATTQATQANITTCAALTTVGTLDAGSITANFGTINNGASAITTTGDITGGGIHVTGDTTAGDNAALGYTATEGLIMTGQGSTNDLTFKNDADGEVMKVLTGTTTLTMAGAIQLGETSVKLDAALSGDAKWSGITIAGTSGVTTLAIGDLIYLNANDSRWELVDANLSDGYDKQLGIALTAAGDGSALEVLVFGKVRSATFPAFTVGSPLYMSETAGDVTHTCPTTADVCVRIVGIALTSTDLLFNPSNDHLIHV